MNIFRNIYDWFASLLSSVFRIKRISNEEARGIIEEQRALDVLKALDEVSEPIDTHPKGTSTFDPKSERAIAGLDFQNSVLWEFEKWNLFSQHITICLGVFELV